MSYARNLATIARSGIATVDTVADLRALNMEVYPERIRTLGAVTVKDGGGGIWYWDGADTTTPDNTGTVVADAGNTGRWKRQYIGAVNVRWFGAQCDCTYDRATYAKTAGTDDTLALQAAFNYVENKPEGGELLIDGMMYLAATNAKTIGGGGVRKTALDATKHNTTIRFIKGGGVLIDEPNLAFYCAFAAGTNVVTDPAVTPVYSFASFPRDGQKTITLTAGAGANFKAGDWIVVRCGKTANYAWTPWGEFAKIRSVAGDVLALELPLMKSYKTDGTNPDGVQNVQSRVIENCSIVGEGTLISVVQAAGSQSLTQILGGTAANFRFGEGMHCITDCRTFSFGVTDSVFSDYRVDLLSTTETDPWVFTADKCSVRSIARNIRVNSAGGCMFHIHEGSNVNVQNVLVHCDGSALASARNVLSVRSAFKCNITNVTIYAKNENSARGLYAENPDAFQIEQSELNINGLHVYCSDGESVIYDEIPGHKNDIITDIWQADINDANKTAYLGKRIFLPASWSSFIPASEMFIDDSFNADSKHEAINGQVVLKLGAVNRKAYANCPLPEGAHALYFRLYGVLLDATTGTATVGVSFKVVNGSSTFDAPTSTVTSYPEGFTWTSQWEIVEGTRTARKNNIAGPTGRWITDSSGILEIELNRVGAGNTAGAIGIIGLEVFRCD